MGNKNRGNRKYVFVCGLQRSGTSVLGRNVARLEKYTGFKDTGVIEDEGQYLQDGSYRRSFVSSAADAYALMVRLTTRSKRYVKKQLRTHLPGPLKVKIQRLLQ